MDKIPLVGETPQSSPFCERKKMISSPSHFEVFDIDTCNIDILFVIVMQFKTATCVNICTGICRICLSSPLVTSLELRKSVPRRSTLSHVYYILENGVFKTPVFWVVILPM